MQNRNAKESQGHPGSVDWKAIFAKHDEMVAAALIGMPTDHAELLKGYYLPSIDDAADALGYDVLDIHNFRPEDVEEYRLKQKKAEEDDYLRQLREKKTVRR